MIVADTNLVVSLVVDEGAASKWARRAWKADREWVLAPFWRAEILSALAGQVRDKNGPGLTWDLVREAAARAEQLFPPTVDRPVSPAAVIRELERYPDLSAYDAGFLALAHELDVPLVTNDRALMKKVPDRSIIALSSFAV